MKLIIFVAVALAAVAVATPVEPEPATIVKSNFESNPEGGYVFSFETSDGVSRVETGELKEALDENNKPLQVISVRGSYAYPDSKGNVVQINYHADDTGYHAEGDSIPKVPAGR